MSNTNKWEKEPIKTTTKHTTAIDSCCPFVWWVSSFDFDMWLGTFRLNFPRSSVFLRFYFLRFYSLYYITDDLICYRSMTSQFLGNTMRHTTNDVLLEFLPRSQMSCSSACLKDWHCKGYNYNDDVCRLFNSKSKSSADLTSDATWSYFEKSDEDLYSCIWREI